MNRGTYVAASQGLLQFRKLEVVSNNLANINTPGFKRQFLIGEEQTFDQTLAQLHENEDPYARGDHKRCPGTVNVATVTDFSQGPIQRTNNPLDLALRRENEFFVVNTPEGEMYTRAGNFTLNQEGELVTKDGMQVLGDGGALIANGVDAKFSPDGSLTVNGDPVGRVRVVRFEDTTGLERVGAMRFKLSAGSAAPVQVQPDVETDSLEMANVSAISSVIDLITAQRGFEAYTKTAQSVNEMNELAAQRLGRNM